MHEKCLWLIRFFRIPDQRDHSSQQYFRDGCINQQCRGLAVDIVLVDVIRTTSSQNITGFSIISYTRPSVCEFSMPLQQSSLTYFLNVIRQRCSRELGHTAVTDIQNADVNQANKPYFANYPIDFDAERFFMKYRQTASSINQPKIT